MKLQDFPINGSEKVCDGRNMLLATGSESLFLVKLQTFTINSSEGACDGVCF